MCQILLVRIANNLAFLIYKSSVHQPYVSSNRTVCTVCTTVLNEEAGSANDVLIERSGRPYLYKYCSTSPIGVVISVCIGEVIEETQSSRVTTGLV